MWIGPKRIAGEREKQILYYYDLRPSKFGETFFLLNPLTSIHDTFSNPASTLFAWVGAEDAECIFLSDFRWSQQVIQWHDFLLMLEGQVVQLPALKTHYAKDSVFETTLY